jgi:peroxiredoxin
LNLRIGGPPPDFVFEIAPGRRLTLRKLAGRPVVLCFGKSASATCHEAVRDAGKASQKAGRPVVLAINDGEAPVSAKQAAAAHPLEATVVADPQRRISSAYGVEIWPTTVFIDAAGLVRSIQYGRQERGGGHV